MEMTQTQRLPVPQQVAWEALNDPALLKQCIPGCESIEPDGENAYQLVLTAAVGPVKARFKGRMALQDIHAPDSYTIQFDGQGGAAGFGKGSANVTLAPEGDETLLTYVVQAQVGGNDSGNDGDSEAPHSDNNDTQSNGAAGDSDADGEENQEKKRKRSWTAWISKS